MKPRTMIVLIVAVAACVVFMLLRQGGLGDLGEKGKEGKKGEKVGQAPRLATHEGFFKPAPLGGKELAVASADGRRIVFAKAEGAWQITEPVRAKADGFKVNEIADALLNPSATAVEGEDAADETTGLDKPRWTVTLTDEQDRTFGLAIGQAAPMSGGARTYVRNQASKQVFVAAFDFASRLSRPVSEYRDKALWDVARADIRRVAIAGGESFELIRADRGWEVAGRQFRAAADPDKVRLLLDKLIFMTVSDFVDDQPAALAVYGLDNPRLTVRMELADQAPLASRPTTTSSPSSQPATTQAVRVYELALGAVTAEKTVYAKLAGSPTVFQLPSSLLEDFQPRLMDLRDRRVLHLGDRGICGVDIQRLEGKTALVEKDGHWRMELPFAGPADGAAVRQWLDHLRALEAESFNDELTPAAAFGLESPQSTITLHFAGSDRTVRLLIGGRSSSGEMTFVRSAEETSVAVVRTADIQTLLQDPAAYWDTTLLRVPEGEEAVAMEVDREGEKFALALDNLDKRSGAWMLTKPVSAPADATAVNDLIAAMRELSARRIVSLTRTVPDKFVKAAGRITVKLTATAAPPTSEPSTSTASATSAPAPPTKTKTYTLHAIGLEGIIYAWLEGGTVAAVGEMDPAFPNRLTAELRRRDVGMPADGNVEGIRITADKATLVLHRRSGQWRCEADPYVNISDVKVDAFLKNVRLLKAQRFVAHRGGGEKKVRKGFGLDRPHLVVEISPAAGAAYKLEVSATGPEAGGDCYATCSAVEGVFLLSSQTIVGLSKTLEDFSQ